ncbi:MAG: hypothetical protein M3065_01065, partial [Actinomycetota bacterium]|nr:hypothetical protein [Actinomycetota bacterium]
MAARAEEALRAEYMPRRARWLAFGALAALVMVGLAIRLPDDPALGAVGAAASLGAAVLLVRA